MGLREFALRMVVLTPLGLGGCQLGQVGSGIETVGTGLSDVAHGIERASKNVETGAKSLSASLDTLARLDPAGINRLLRENTSLRDDVMKLSARLGPAIPGAGVIEILDRAVKVRITRYKGSHRLNGWLDTTSNPFWTNRTLIDTLAGPQFNLRSVISQAFNSQRSLCQTNDCHLHEAEEAAQKHAEEVLTTYVKGSGIAPGAGLTSIDLNTRFGSGGLHQIVVQITPLAADATGHWLIIGQVYLVAPGGTTEEIVAEFQYDDALFPSYKFGNPLPVLVNPVSVKTR
jgi:hypothetical protein